MRRPLAIVLGLAMVPAMTTMTTPTATGAPAATAPSTGEVRMAPDDVDEPEQQWRGLWVDTFHDGIYNPEQVTELVTHAGDLGVNALVVQVGRWFDCYCNDSTFPRTHVGIDPEPYDPLTEVITQAHAAGIEVHAWVNATTLWNAADPPPDPQHPFNVHGPDAEGTDRWLNEREDGEEVVGTMAYIDPANPAPVDYMVEGIASIVSNYDVDGINLDYIRYPDYNSDDYVNDWGYSDISLARFAAETGRTDRPAPDDVEFSDFRRGLINEFVRKIYLTTLAIDPALRLSVNATSYSYGPQHYDGWENARPYANVMQDWERWLTEGIVDTVTTMNYKRNHLPEQQEMFSQWNEFMAGIDTDRHVVSGPALYLNSIYDSLRQAEQVRDAGLEGWMGYSYAFPTADAAEDPDAVAEQRMRLTVTLRSTVFEHDVTVPEMTWKTEPTTGMVSGQVTLRGDGDGDGDGDVAGLSVQVRPAGGGEPVQVRTDGSGWFGALHLEPGNYRVEVVDGDVANAPPATVRVVAGEVGQVSLQVRLER